MKKKPDDFTYLVLLFSMYPQIKFNVYGKELIIPLATTAQDIEDTCDETYTTEVVRRILAAKDQGLVSDKAYHELRMALPEDIRDRIPPLSAVIQERRAQNKTINTIPIPQVTDYLLRTL